MFFFGFFCKSRSIYFIIAQQKIIINALGESKEIQIFPLQSLQIQCCVVAYPPISSQRMGCLPMRGQNYSDHVLLSKNRRTPRWIDSPAFFIVLHSRRMNWNSKRGAGTQWDVCISSDHPNCAAWMIASSSSRWIFLNAIVWNMMLFNNEGDKDRKPMWFACADFCFWESKKHSHFAEPEQRVRRQKWKPPLHSLSYCVGGLGSKIIELYGSRPTRTWVGQT